MTQHSQTIKIDGIRYSAIVERFGADCFASWRCHHCRGNASGMQRERSAEAATAAMMIGLWDHHDSCHVQVTEPPLAPVFAALG
jgi:hypothetical protein